MAEFGAIFPFSSVLGGTASPVFGCELESSSVESQVLVPRWSLDLNKEEGHWGSRGPDSYGGSCCHPGLFLEESRLSMSRYHTAVHPATSMRL